MITTNTDRAMRAAMIAAAIAVGCGLGVAVAEPEDVNPAVPTVEQTGPALTYTDLVAAVTGIEPAEGDPAFDCRRHGDRVCTPGNPQGVPPGFYRETTGTDLCDLMLPPVAGDLKAWIDANTIKPGAPVPQRE